MEYMTLRQTGKIEDESLLSLPVLLEFSLFLYVDLYLNGVAILSYSVTAAFSSSPGPKHPCHHHPMMLMAQTWIVPEITAPPSSTLHTLP
jgi:hypothetical protein